MVPASDNCSLSHAQDQILTSPPRPSKPADTVPSPLLQIRTNLNLYLFSAGEDLRDIARPTLTTPPNPVSTPNLKHIVSSTSLSILNTLIRSLSSAFGSTAEGSMTPFLTRWRKRRA
jgi:hypothetical protein